MRGVFFFWMMAVASAFASETSAPSRIVEIERDKEWVVDAAGHPWMVPFSGPTALKEWDGTKWITHDFPPGVRCDVGLHADDRGRIWVNSELAPISIYDPRSEKWQTFPNLEEAFLASKDTPVRFLPNRWMLTPAYSADRKRMAFRWQVLGISYYDGATWQKWRRKDITRTKDGDSSVGLPWFDDEGKLRVNIRDGRDGTSWQLDDSRGWLPVPWTSHFPDDPWSEHRSVIFPTRRLVTPEGSVPADPNNVAVDNLGITWLISNGQLYKAMPGLCVPIFSPDEKAPFQSVRRLQDVYVDPQGNAFLFATGSGTRRWVILPKGTAPKTRITISKKEQDSVRAHFEVGAQQPIYFRWRLDGGDWSVSKDADLTMSHLLNGDHVLQVTAIDGDLNMEKVPVEARFATHMDEAKLMKQLMSQLLDSSYDERKTAVIELDRRPLLALPALRKARETATEDQRWWIDVAIQECERDVTKNK